MTKTIHINHTSHNKAEPVMHQAVRSRRSTAGPFGPRVKKSDHVEVIASGRNAVNVYVVTPQPYASPAQPKQQQSRVLHRQVVKHPHRQVEQRLQHIQYERFVEPAQQSGKLRSALQSCFGLFAS